MNPPARLVNIPEEVKDFFIEDVKKYNTHQLSIIYSVHRSTIDRWKQRLEWEDYHKEHTKCSYTRCNMMIHKDEKGLVETPEGLLCYDCSYDFKEKYTPEKCLKCNYTIPEDMKDDGLVELTNGRLCADCSFDHIESNNKKSINDPIIIENSKNYIKYIIESIKSLRAQEEKTIKDVKELLIPEYKKVENNLIENKTVSIQPKKAFEITAVVSDIHVPFQNNKSWEAFLSAIDYYKCSGVIINGDLLDFNSISRFDCNPQRSSNIQDDIDMAKLSILYPLLQRGLKIHINFGNHEVRLEDHLVKNYKLSSLRALKLENLLELEKNKITFLPYDSFLRYKDNFIVTHGSIVRTGAVNSAKAEFSKYGMSGISGHVHRLGTYKRTTLNGIDEWSEGGHLCDMNKLDYVHSIADWQAGFALLLNKPGDNKVHTELIPITEENQIITAGFQYLG